MAMLLGLPASPAQAQECLGDDDPQYAVICAPGGSSCPRPVISQEGAADAQEAVITVTVPDYNGKKAKKIQLDTYWTDAAGTWHQIWERQSVQGIPPSGLAAGEHRSFGIPGLMENLNAQSGSQRNYVEARLLWDDGTTSCPSERLPIETPAFSSGVGPAKPSTADWRVWDDFHRPPTDAVGGDPPGDGLGPADVWTTSDMAGGGSEARIADDPTQQHAEFDPSSWAFYEGKTQFLDHTFADARFRVYIEPSSSFKYNLQVQARVGQPNPNWGVPSYAAKLVKGARGCPDPTLIIFRTGPEGTEPPDDWGEYNEAKCGENGLPDPEMGDLCRDGTVEPPLEGNEAGFSNPVWLRIEVDSVGSDDDPQITASVYWEGDCDGDGTPHELECGCSKTRLDDEAPNVLRNVTSLGWRWGASFHEKTYWVDIFRAAEDDGQ